MALGLNICGYLGNESAITPRYMARVTAKQQCNGSTKHEETIDRTQVQYSVVRKLMCVVGGMLIASPILAIGRKHVGPC